MNQLTQNKKVIVFEIEEEKYAVDITSVRSIEKVLPLTRIPQADEFIVGIVNLRGNIIPIMDLKKRLGGGSTITTDNTRILVANKDDLVIGLLVDKANDVLDLNLDLIEPPPQMIGKSKEQYIEGVCRIQNSLVVLLNLNPIINATQLSELDFEGDFQREEQHGL